jgi:hypothetical protein
MLNKNLNVQECDATEVNKSVEAGYIINAISVIAN